MLIICSLNYKNQLVQKKFMKKLTAKYFITVLTKKNLKNKGNFLLKIIQEFDISMKHIQHGKTFTEQIPMKQR